MPLYEYECQQCSERLEAIQKYAEEPYTICPHCAGALRKLISAPAIQFKGSGFYITDYAKKSSESKETKGESQGDTKGETKSDTKSDTKRDTSGSKAASE